MALSLAPLCNDGGRDSPLHFRVHFRSENRYELLSYCVIPQSLFWSKNSEEIRTYDSLAHGSVLSAYFLGQSL